MPFKWLIRIASIKENRWCWPVKINKKTTKIPNKLYHRLVQCNKGCVIYNFVGVLLVIY